MITKFDYLFYKTVVSSINIAQYSMIRNNLKGYFNCIVPTQLIRICKRNFICNFAIAVLLFLFNQFLYFFMYFFILLQALKFVYQKRNIKARKSLEGAEYLLLNYSSRFYDSYRDTNRHDDAIVISNFFGIKENYPDIKYKKIDIRELIHKEDVAYALKHAFASVRIAHAFAPNKNVIYSLQALAWFVTEKALERCHGFSTYVFCNMDRWSYLFSATKGVRTIFIQHGLLNQNITIQYFPYQWGNNISTVYTYNDEQEKLIRSFVKGNPDFKYLTPKIKLCPIEKKTNLTILLICCQTFFADIEKKLIIALASCEDITLYVKPHPVHPKDLYFRLAKKNRFILIENRTFYPDVDLVIGYDSTLAYEYSLLGKHVFLHTEMEIQELLMIVQQEIHPSASFHITRNECV